MCACVHIYICIYMCVYIWHWCAHTYTRVLFSALPKGGLRQTTGGGKVTEREHVAINSCWMAQINSFSMTATQNAAFLSILDNTHNLCGLKGAALSRTEGSLQAHTHSHPGRTGPNFSYILGSRGKRLCYFLTFSCLNKFPGGENPS